MPLYPDDLKYSEKHEWVRMMDSGSEAEVGITHHAQDSLGDVVFVELPAVGSEVSQFAKFGEVESVKAVSDLFSPVSGAVIAANQALVDSPELLNGDPYGQGWIIRVQLNDTDQLDNLMDAAEYQSLLE